MSPVRRDNDVRFHVFCHFISMIILSVIRLKIDSIIGTTFNDKNMAYKSCPGHFVNDHVNCWRRSSQRNHIAQCCVAIVVVTDEIHMTMTQWSCSGLKFERRHLRGLSWKVRQKDEVWQQWRYDASLYARPLFLKGRYIAAMHMIYEHSQCLIIDLVGYCSAVGLVMFLSLYIFRERRHGEMEGLICCDSFTCFREHWICWLWSM